MMKTSLFILKDHSRSVFYIVFSLVAGICLLLFPQMTTSVVFWGMAVVLMLMGAANLVSYFRSDVHRAITGDSMASGLLLIVLGLVLGFAQETIASLLPVIFGVVLFVGGILKTQGACDLKRMGDQRWFLVLIGAGVSLVCGLIVLINPFATWVTLMRVMGAFLLTEGIQDAVCVLRYEKIRKSFTIH